MVMLDFEDSVKLLNEYRIPHSKLHFVKSKAEAVHVGKKLGFPLVMKIISPKIVHKSDVGAVRVGVNSASSVEETYDRFSKRFPKEPIVVQKMARGLQIIVGAKQDPQFGPTVVFGIGGIFVEIIKDFSLRVAPLTRKDALEMVHGIKAERMLEGVRGKNPVNINKLVDILLKVSKMMVEHQEIKELDLNPIFANDKEALVVDVRIMI